MAQATILETHLYELGEPGSFNVNTVALDSVGSTNFIGKGSRVPSTSTVSPSPISTTYTHFDNTGSFGSDYSGNYGADFSGFATDNFAVELWVRTSDVTVQGNSGDIAEIFRMGTVNGSLEFYLRNDGLWMAGYKDQAYIGSGSAAVADEWVNLAVIRDDGNTAFYVNGVQLGGTTSVAPVHNAGAGHIAIGSGAANTFTGDIDNIRMFTFDVSDDPVAALTYNNIIPEPSSAALLLGIGALATLTRRRR